MSGEHSSRVPLNEIGVDEVLASIPDSATQNLVRLAISMARMRFMRWEGMSDDAFEAQLPKSPFDMTFFASLMKGVFSKWDLLERIAKGESIPTASGWDV
jgi:hypothetical protein